MADAFSFSGPRGENESPREFAQRGLVLLRQGHFDQAADVLQQAAQLLPDDRSTHLAFASVLTRLGLQNAARDVFRDFVQRNPLGKLSAKIGVGDPLLLVVRGFDKTKPTIGKRTNGDYKPKLRGGHFTIQYLLEKDAIARRTFTIAGDAGINEDLLPDFSVMLNTIAEPDIEDASLKSLEQYLAKHPTTTIINKPQRVRDTARDKNYERLQGVGDFTFPKTVRFELTNGGPKDIANHLAENNMPMPVIIRRVGTQTGKTTQLIENDGDLFQYAAKPLSGEFYAIAYREILWRGEYFRKLRLFCIDGEFYPVVCHLDKIWNVHGGNRKEIMRDDEVLMAEEQAFLANWKDFVGQENADILYKIADATDLEFFGIDFTVDDDGKIFIYELNASMRHSFDHALNFPYKLPYDQAISAAFNKMVLSRVHTKH
ncbi:MAG: tetratricopeptide repeat protein [Paracoccaceae bacterium]|nr:tetratricopeptide repeat protein [Paracoccaceae bacterium]